MQSYRSLDSLVRARLKKWPQRPPGLPQAKAGQESWLRGRPSDNSGAAHPFLKFPGSNRLRTLPDGLWLNFGGNPAEPFCDIFVIEACSSLPNLLDKRSRFAPSTQSLLAVCPVPWLMAASGPDDPTPRWRLTGVLRAEPATPLVLPIRDIRVLYGLKNRHYSGIAESTIPSPHEYYVPIGALTAEDSDKDPQLQALVARTSSTANFLTVP